jgi:hypothetical protein
VKYGHPVNLDDLRAESRTCSKDRLKQIYEETATRVMQSIAELQPKRD